jgi:hypothetical protein
MFGLTLNSSPLLLEFVSHSLGTTLGNSRAPPGWTEWKGCCVVCQRLILDGAGVFCANFCSACGPWKACRQVWCGKCYKPLDDNKFPIAKPMDEDRIEVGADEDDDRYIQARNGDSLVTPFQCETCHFRNLMERNPIGDHPQDTRVMKLIRRANLDAFWAREPKTVNATLTACRQASQVASSLGIRNKLFRPMGPFPLEDTFGMGAAIVMLQLSLKPGKYATHLQFGTVQKLRSALSNVYHALLEGQQATVMAKDTRKLVVMKCPTYGEFFERFMKGMHKRMGEDVRPDKAISIQLMKELSRQLEEEWVNDMANRFRIAMEASFYLMAFCCALQGEEVPLADLFGTARYWLEGERHVTPHVVIPLIGRFKGETGERMLILCSVAVTSHGLEPRKWIGRLLEIYHQKGVRNGSLFRDSHGNKLRTTHFEPSFLDRLNCIKNTRPELMSGVEDVHEELGILRSFQRGATSETVNQGVPPDVIDTNNRWRKVMKAGSSHPSFSMREHYTDVRMTLDHRLRFSMAL